MAAWPSAGREMSTKSGPSDTSGPASRTGDALTPRMSGVRVPHRPPTFTHEMRPGDLRRGGIRGQLLVWVSAWWSLGASWSACWPERRQPTDPPPSPAYSETTTAHHNRTSPLAGGDTLSNITTGYCSVAAATSSAAPPTSPRGASAGTSPTSTAIRSGGSAPSSSSSSGLPSSRNVSRRRTPSWPASRSWSGSEGTDREPERTGARSRLNHTVQRGRGARRSVAVPGSGSCPACWHGSGRHRCTDQGRHR